MDWLLFLENDLRTRENLYALEKELSAEIDAGLGFKFPDTLSGVPALTTATETWSHLSPQAFQTPYPELLRIVREVDPDFRLRSWVDLGAAYGRLGIVLGKVRPEAKFLGIEIDEGRVQETQRVFTKIGLAPESIRLGNCASENLPVAAVYFIYDFGSAEEIESALRSLQKIAHTHPMRVIGRGKRVRAIIEKNHPWLGAVHPAVHRLHYSIYRSHAEEGPAQE